MLLTETYYRNITGDTATPADAAVANASAAQDLLEDALGVPGFLESATRTETLTVHGGGVAYPTACPITDAPGYTVLDGNTLYGATSSLTSFVALIGSDLPATAEVTYTGGWTDETAPGYMRRDLAFVTQAILTPAAVLQLGQIPGNPTSASVGDVSVSYGPNGAAPDGLALVGVEWSYFTMRHRDITP
jgi:hypothetical protein